MHKPGKIFLRVLSSSFLLIAGVSSAVFAQGPGKDSVPKSTAPINTHITNNDDAQSSFTLQPIVRGGIGLLSYIGNVKSGSGTSNIQSPSQGRVGYDIGFAQPITPVTEVSLNFLYGDVSEVEQIPNAFWNFQSTLAGGGINVMFKVLPKQQVTPYFIVGVESYEFISRADIYNQNGIQYYGWSDGTVRSLPQNSPYASTAQTLNIAYSYQTDIRVLNLDGSGTGYNQQTFAIPVGVGFLFHLNPKAEFMLGTTLHYTFTDHIDGLTPQVQGPLKGTLSNDMFAFTYASFRFNLSRVHAKRSRQQYDEGASDPSLLQDTVHPDKPGEFDTSLAAIEMQYERYMDTTGKFGGIHQVDSFHWQDKNWIGVGPAPRARNNGANNASNSHDTGAGNNAASLANNNASSPNNNASSPNNNNSTPDNSAASNNNATPPNNNTVPDNSAASNNNNVTQPVNNSTPPNNNSTVPDNTTANNNNQPPNNSTSPPANNNSVPDNSAVNNNSNTVNNNVTPPVNAAGGADVNSGNVIYKVQILASQHKLAEGINFAGISDKASVDVENGTYKYTTGNFSQYSDAQKYLAQLKAIGYTDAFIRATQNGKSVPVPEHQAATGNPTNSTNNNSTVPAAASVSIPAEAMAATKEGLVFKVQFGVFGVSPKQPFINMFNSYADHSIVKDDAGLNHYMAGNYNTLQSAAAARDKARAAGVKDVCIKAVYNGKIISMSEAVNMLKK